MKINVCLDRVQEIKKIDFTLQELTAIKSRLQDLTREVERLRNASHPTLKSKLSNIMWIAGVS